LRQSRTEGKRDKPYYPERLGQHTLLLRLCSETGETLLSAPEPCQEWTPSSYAISETSFGAGDE
jgi:hypothetical protein